MRIREYERAVGSIAQFTFENDGLFPCSAVEHTSKSLLGALTRDWTSTSPLAQARNILASCGLHLMEEKEALYSDPNGKATGKESVLGNRTVTLTHK